MKYIMRAKCLCIIYECGILPKFCGIITIPWQYPERVYIMYYTYTQFFLNKKLNFCPGVSDIPSLLFLLLLIPTAGVNFLYSLILCCISGNI